MPENPPQSPPTPVTITFPTGNAATLVVAEAGTDAATLLQLLNVAAPSFVLILFGGADSLAAADASKLRQTLTRAILPAIADAEALILDGGTNVGVMALMGESAARQEKKLRLLGVAPRGKVKYPGGPDLGSVADAADLEPNHSSFILSPTDEWGGEIDTMFAVATELARTAPIVALVAGGGDNTKAEIERAARAGWPIIVLEQSGGFSDELVRMNDPAVRRIAAEADLRPFPPDGDAANFQAMIDTQRDSRGLLTEAWQRFTDYDGNARRLQWIFGRFQSSILLCGILGILLVAVQKEIELYRGDLSQRVPNPEAQINRLDHWSNGLRPVIVVFPILTAVLLGISHSFRPAEKWVLLRGSAEAVKREIYRYRSRAGGYAADELKDTSAEALFAERLKTINQRLFQSEVSKSGLRPYPVGLPTGDGDDGYTNLSADRYLTLRVDNQLKFYTRRTEKLGGELFWYSVGSLSIGGFGSVLAAVHLELWIAVTTASAAALAAYLKYYQTEETLVKYNRAKADLTDVKAWWAQFSRGEKRLRKTQAQLVDLTERVLEQETAGWSQRMIDALSDLRREEEARQQKGEPQNPEERPAAPKA